MKLILVLLLLIIKVFGQEDLSFDEWQVKFGIKFNTIHEKLYREKIFLAKKREIKAFNSNPANTYKKRLNQFSHLNSKDFKSKWSKNIVPKHLIKLAAANSKPIITNPTNIAKLLTNYPFGNYNSSNAPSSVNYSYLMQPAQDQGECGSCWAFAALSQIEAMMKIRNPNFNTVLSPQYLVDCDLIDNACNGGGVTTALNWLKTNGNNAPSMASYPYTSAGRGTCKSGVPKISLGINSVIENYFNGNEDLFKAHIANYGPQSVYIRITEDFQAYSSGTFYGEICACQVSEVYYANHAVVVTGYDSDYEYWLIKNSWGTNWGEDGYMKLGTNRKNQCTVACWSVYPA